MVLYRVTDITKLNAWFNNINADTHAFIAYLNEPFRSNGRLTNGKHFARITVEAILDDRHIDVKDVAIFQNLVTWDAVANHMVI